MCIMSIYVIVQCLFRNAMWLPNDSASHSGAGFNFQSMAVHLVFFSSMAMLYCSERFSVHVGFLAHCLVHVLMLIKVKGNKLKYVSSQILPFYYAVISVIVL